MSEIKGITKQYDEKQVAFRRKGLIIVAVYLYVVISLAIGTYASIRYENMCHQSGFSQFIVGTLFWPVVLPAAAIVAFFISPDRTVYLGCN